MSFGISAPDSAAADWSRDDSRVVSTALAMSACVKKMIDCPVVASGVALFGSRVCMTTDEPARSVTPNSGTLSSTSMISLIESPGYIFGSAGASASAPPLTRSAPVQRLAPCEKSVAQDV